MVTLKMTATRVVYFTQHYERVVQAYKQAIDNELNPVVDRVPGGWRITEDRM